MAIKAILCFIVIGTSTTWAVSLSKRSAVTTCLQRNKMPFDQAGTSTWTTDIAAFNTRVQYTPVAVAAPVKIPQIQAAVKCGVQSGVKVTAKSGGHSYASFGLGGENGHLVIDLENMYNVTLDNTTNIATVQPGARLGHVATQLYTQGKRAFSHGTCPGVGVSGHALHGGYGMSSHKYGLATDAIVGMSVVLANGSLVQTSKTQNPELFWGLRGAGSNFGIVVSYNFSTFPVDGEFTYFNIQFNWNETSSLKNYAILQNFAMSSPAELTMRGYVSAFQSYFEGLYQGGKAGLTTALQPFLDQTGLKLSSATNTTWLAAFAHYANAPTDPTVPYSYHETFYAKSLMLKSLQGQSLQNFLAYKYHNTSTNTRSWWYQIDLHGGNYSAVTNGDHSVSSYPHRDKLFLIQFYDRTFSATYPSTGFSFLDDWVATTVAPLSTTDYGMYINYADSRLARTQAEQLYYGSNLVSLQQLKAAYDPTQVFYYPQSVEPET